MYFRPMLANHYQKNCFLKSDFELVVLGPIPSARQPVKWEKKI